eukprot:3558592-Amphidinium_carterae.1
MLAGSCPAITASFALTAHQNSSNLWGPRVARHVGRSALEDSLSKTLDDRLERRSIVRSDFNACYPWSVSMPS